jgi:hypothetical protein
VKTITEATHTVTYSMPLSSMEPTIHCGRPSPGCEAAVDDPVVAAEPVRNVKREDVVVFHPR